MTTFGAIGWPGLVGVPGPPPPLWLPTPPEPCCDGKNGWWGIEPGVPCGGACSEPLWPWPAGPFSFGGKGLFLESTKAEVEEVGVPCAEELGELALPEGVAPVF